MNDFVYKPSKALSKIAKVVKENDLAIIQGGQGAGKTIAILMLLIDVCWRLKVDITICSSELSKLKDTAMLDFVKILKDWGFFNQSEWNKSESVWRPSSGGLIEFIGLDKSDVGKGRRRDYVFINETNKISLSSFTDITARAKKVICDFNPDKRFFLHDLQNNTNSIVLTYLDNNFLPQKEINNILNYKTRGFDANGKVINTYWANMWRVYGEGQIGQAEGRIYNWKSIEYSNYLKIQSETYYGVDWGSNHPFAIVEVKYYDGNLYVHELNYQSENNIRKSLSVSQLQNINQQENDGLVTYMFNKLGVPKTKWIVCDNNQPNKIMTLRNIGYEYAIAVGGKMELVNRVRVLNNLNIYYTNTSKNIEYEQENYCYSKDKYDVITDYPIDADNHTLDAIAYCVQKLFKEGIIKNI